MLYSDSQSGEIFDKVTMGVVHYIKQKPGVHDVMFGHYNGVNKDLLESWEEDNSCKLPEDLKNFYMTINGLLIEWDIEYNEAKQLVGRIEVNSLESLNLVSTETGLNSSDVITLKDLDMEDNSDDADEHRKPLSRDKFFELNSDEAYGKVCLVYKHNKTNHKDVKLCDPDVWFLDYSLQWHFLASTFTSYYRMLITHLGISGWPYLFTGVDLSPESLLWFSMYLSDRLPISNRNPEPIKSAKKDVVERNKIDFTTLFKSKPSDKRKVDTNKQGRNQTSGRQRGGKTGMAKTTQKGLSR